MIVTILSISLFLILAFGTVLPSITVQALSSSVKKYDKAKTCATDTALRTNNEGDLYNFNCGHVTTKNGKTFRQFSLIVNENVTTEIAPKINFPAWTFNNSIPAPTIRVTEGDNVSITVINDKENKHSHSMHMHSIHAGAMDGTMLNGASGAIKPGSNFTYNFIAQPFGVYPFHCHVNPIAEHINHGLYGMLIIDPKTPRPSMHELAMVLNGYDLEFNEPYPRPITPQEANETMKGDEGNKTLVDLIPQEHDNAIYTVNGFASYYMDHPIPMKLGEKYRIYMINMLDFEQNSFHLHGQMFDYYVAGTSKTPSFKTDMVDFQQGDRGIIELKYDLPGCYMFHGHIDQIASRGWSGAFNVTDSEGKNGCTAHNDMPTPPTPVKADND